MAKKVRTTDKTPHDKRIEWIINKIQERVKGDIEVKIYSDSIDERFRTIELAFVTRGGGASYISLDSPTANSVLFQVERIYLALMNNNEEEAKDIMGRMLGEMLDAKDATQ